MFIVKLEANIHVAHTQYIYICLSCLNYYDIKLFLFKYVKVHMDNSTLLETHII